MTVSNDSTSRITFYNVPSTFQESTSVVMKGRVEEYSRILKLLRIIDLSNNHLSGDIPKEITRLVALKSLNLSQNALTGKIPNEIGAMLQLESMDFSQNQLSGEIPESMSKLTFLAMLNLSYNKLSGRIPRGTQLEGFDRSSFMGNQLCGVPLPNNCSSDADVPGLKTEEEDDGNGFEIDWFCFYVSFAPGFVVGFWIVMGPLFFVRRWRHAYFRFLGMLWDKIW